MPPSYRAIDGFIRAGLLSTDQRDDDRAIERAIAQLCREGFRVVRERATAGGWDAAIYAWFFICSNISFTSQGPGSATASGWLHMPGG